MRKHKVVTIDSEGRDRGKSFLVVEKSAFETERWATRALLALSRSGIDIPEGALEAGALGVLLAGMSGFQKLTYEDAEPLLEEMIGCIHFVPDAVKKDPLTGRPLSRALLRGDEANDGDIEEMGTLLKLRGEALELHLGFSVTAALSTLAAAATSNQRATPTSRKPAARRSRPAKPA